jgi:hypothetical protein
MTAPKKICFIYPSRNIGGAQILFERLAIALSKRNKIAVTIVDYSDGFLASRLENYQNISLIEFKSIPLNLEKDMLIILPLSHLIDLGDFLNIGHSSGYKILFWSIHPDNIRHIVYNRYRRPLLKKNLLKSLVRNLDEKSNIAYMDGVNYKSVQKVLEKGTVKSPVYIPIPMTSIRTKKMKRKGVKQFSIIWLGRLSNDKVNSVIKIIDECAKLKDKYNIKLHIIGEGIFREDIRKYSDKVGVSCEFKGVLINEELTQFLCENADLGVSMGTSCLEIAARGIPSALIDYSHTEFPKDIKYNWIFETSDYNLGGNIAVLESRRNQFKDLIELVIKERELVSTKSKEYVDSNHSIDVSSEALLFALSQIKRIDYKELKSIVRIANPYHYILARAVYKKMRILKGYIIKGFKK